MAKRKAAGGRRSKSAARKAGRGGARKARSTRKTARRKAAARKGARKATARKGAARKATARKGGARKAVRRRSARAKGTTVRKTPALNRPRRTVGEEDATVGPPSSLDMDRHASAARTGRQEMKEKRSALTQTGPGMTGGDVDADWESAYSVGDEAPGGDNPTPDQDIVDDIGRAVGVEYEDNEELKSEEKIVKRDRHRWELDPASSEDYNDR